MKCNESSTNMYDRFRKATGYWNARHEVLNAVSVSSHTKKKTSCARAPIETAHVIQLTMTGVHVWKTKREEPT